MSAVDLRAVSTYELEAEVSRRRNLARELEDLATMGEVLADAGLVIRLDRSSGHTWSVGPTEPHARNMLRDAMVQAIEARIAELEGGPS